MSNKLYEFSISPSKEDGFGGIYLFLVVYRIINIVLAIISGVFACFWWNFAWLICLFFLVSSMILNLFLKKYFSSFDYSFVDSSIRLTKIVKNKKRKPLIKFDCKNILAIGAVNGELHNKYKSSDVKKIRCFSRQIEERDYFIYLEKLGKKYLVTMAYDEIFLSNIIRVTGTKIIEEEYKKQLIKQ